MAGRTRRTLVSRRRRGDEEGEDEDGPVVVEDSQSEGSVLTEMDSEDADADAEDSFVDAPTTAPSVEAPAYGQPESSADRPKSATKKRKAKAKTGKPMAKEPVLNGSAQGSFRTAADTEAMMNGLQVDETSQEPAVDFESMEQNKVGNGQAREEQRRQHQDHRRQRESNPAYIPNRGGFYMHDSRAQPYSSGPQSIRGAWQGGRGRGRGAGPVGGPFSPASQAASAPAADNGVWKHDLHDTINEEQTASGRTANATTNADDESARIFRQVAPATDQTAPSPIISFNTTTLLGKVNLRVQLPGMAAPISYAEAPVKRYTRLPNHRPPLRRDKPVRISLPDNPPRYIFPSPDRSFIFIPRQMRPNQQGFGRYSHQNRSVGGYGYSSRRTSMYGGSVYSGSVAPSRRPSIASQFGREQVFSPSASIASGFQPPSYRPVVRMPPSGQMYSGATTPAQQYSGYQTPTMPPITNYPPPQQPTYQGTPTTTVHQPRPQKAISVSGIDSPAALQQASQPLAQALEPQPFQNQLPEHMHQAQGMFNPLPPQQYFSPAQTYAYTQPPHITTPLGGIPENAVNAQPFQPPPMPYGQAFYPSFQSAPQPAFYGFSAPAQPAPTGFPAVPMFQQQQVFGAPLSALQQHVPEQPQPPMQPSDPLQHPHHQHSNSQSGFVARESNGMVFYTPADQVQQQESEQTYQPAETFTPTYAMPPGGGSGAFYGAFPAEMEVVQDMSANGQAFYQRLQHAAPQ